MIISFDAHMLSSRVHSVWCGLREILGILNWTLLSGLIVQTKERSASLPAGVREEKVLAIRQQLEEGTYDIDGRLSELMDRLLEEDLLG